MIQRWPFCPDFIRQTLAISLHRPFSRYFILNYYLSPITPLNSIHNANSNQILSYFFCLQAQRPENTVMQALESLNDSQVNDFLSGKTPLNLSMRLGDHMMLIQLQLSTVNPSNSASGGSASTSAGSSSFQHSSRSRSMFRSKTTSSARSIAQLQPHPSTSSNNSSKSTNSTPIKFNNTTATTSASTTTTSTHMYKSLSASHLSDKLRSNTNGDGSTNRSLDAIESSNEFDELRKIMRSIGKTHRTDETAENDVDMDTNTMSAAISNADLLEQSPIKSLSNLVSGPIKTSSLKSIPMDRPSTSSQSSASSSTANECDTNDSHAKQSSTYDALNALKTESRSTALLHKTLNNPIAKTKPTVGHAIAHHSRTNAAAHLLNLRRTKPADQSEPSTSKATDDVNKATTSIEATAGSSTNSINTTETLAEASRNLTKTLRKLSKEVFSGKSDAVALVSSEEKRRSTSNASASSETTRSGSHKSSSSGFGSGTVIESMRNHGIYSGTFSGTLNPALQDRWGRPKRDISTVIHILNDLLSATPHYSRGARISFEPAHSSRKYVSDFSIFLGGDLIE